MNPNIKAALIVAATIVASPAFAQYYQQQSPYRQGGQQYQQQYQQQAEPDAEMRVEQLENRLRQMTGQNEELQFRIRQLEDQIQQLQAGGGGAQPAGRPPQGAPQRQGNQAQQPYQGQPVQQQVNAQPQQYDDRQPVQQGGYQQQPGQGYQPPRAQPPQSGAPVPYPSGSGGRRGDAFDPNAAPGAPGQPRALGSIVGQPSAPERQPDIGAPGGRAAGEPLSLSGPGAQASAQPNQDRGQPQARDPIGEQIATLPPSASPKDQYDLGYGYIQRKDYAQAEQTLRGFIKQHPNDRLVADAQYWVGESLYQRQRYRDAAESFLTLTTKYDTATRAPDALLRLGQSLAALKEKEAACAAFGEVTRKYPKASGGVKQGVEREQKRHSC